MKEELDYAIFLYIETKIKLHIPINIQSALLNEGNEIVLYYE